MVQGITPVTVRIRFYKRGKLQYISHLDLVRTMNKVVTRADLPLWYTEGFNPKPKMVFAAPLSIGTESLAEFMDLRLTCRQAPEEIKQALNRNLTEEMSVLEVYYPTTKLTEMKWLRYEIDIDTAGADDALAARCLAVFDADSLLTEKKGKDGAMHSVEIRPLIRSVSISSKEGRLRMDCVLSGDSSAFLNPELLIRCLREKCGILSDPCLTNEGYSILRKEAYCADMSLFR